MMKHEFERIAQIKVTDEMYDIIERMYMVANLDKESFVKLLNLKAIAQPEEETKTIVRIAVDRNPNGTIIHFDAKLIDISIAKGKPIVKRLTPNKADGCCSFDYWVNNVIVK